MGKLFPVLFFINLTISTTAESWKTEEDQFYSTFDLYYKVQMMHIETYFNIKHLLNCINLTTVLEYY